MPMGSPGCVTRPRRSMAVAGWVLGGFWRSTRGARQRSGRGAGTLEPRALLGNERRRSESNRRIEVLQTSALPLGYGAGDVNSQSTWSFSTRPGKVPNLRLAIWLRCRDGDKLPRYLEFLNSPPSVSAGQADGGILGGTCSWFLTPLAINCSRLPNPPGRVRC